MSRTMACYKGITVSDDTQLRHELRERWLGTYVYYYYTENNDPDQVVKPKQNQSQVN